MICPKCGAFSPEESRFCSNCAASFLLEDSETTETSAEPLSTQETTARPEKTTEVITPVPDPAESAEISSVPHQKKGTLWIPIVLLVVMFAAGLSLFWITQGNRPVTDPNMPWFSIREGTLYFDKDHYHGSNELDVPEIVAGQTVTAISSECFAGCDQLTIVSLPNTVQSIGDSAFQNCSALRGLFVPASVSSIGAYAFSGCAALESVCIPGNVKHIGSNAFLGCNSLSYIFYSGSAENWCQLYSEFISPETYIFAADRTIKQGDFPS